MKVPKSQYLSVHIENLGDTKRRIKILFSIEALILGASLAPRE